MIGNLIKLMFYLALMALLVLLAAGMALWSLVSTAIDSIDNASAATASEPDYGERASGSAVTVLPRDLDSIEVEAPALLEGPSAENGGPSVETSMGSLSSTDDLAAEPLVGMRDDDLFLEDDVLPLEDDDFFVEDDAIPLAFGVGDDAPGAHTVTIPVYLCGPAGRYDSHDLTEQVATLRTHVVPFFERESSGKLTLDFIEGGVVSPPSIDWTTVTLLGLHSKVRDSGGSVSNPCVADAMAVNQTGSKKILVLADMRPAEHGEFQAKGYGHFSGPAVALTRNHHRGSSLQRFLRTVAHELGHSILHLCHTHETGKCEIRRGEFVHGKYYDTAEFKKYHDDHVFDDHDDSLMSYETPDAPGNPGVYEFAHHFISCRQRYVVEFDLTGCRGAAITDPGHVARQLPPPIPLHAPGPPTALVAEARDGAILVSWSPPVDDGGTTTTNYRVEYSIGTLTQRYVPTSARTRLIDGLTNGVEHAIRVFAENEFGTSEAATITAVPKGASTTVAPRQVRISWGSDATGRGAECPASANCRNLTYELVGFGPGPTSWSA